jgi:hypothetical protein
MVGKKKKCYLFFSSSLCFQEQCLSLSHSKNDPGSGKKFIPDPGGNKAPDFGSATLIQYNVM